MIRNIPSWFSNDFNPIQFKWFSDLIQIVPASVRKDSKHFTGEGKETIAQKILRYAPYIQGRKKGTTMSVRTLHYFILYIEGRRKGTLILVRTLHDPFFTCRAAKRVQQCRPYPQIIFFFSRSGLQKGCNRGGTHLERSFLEARQGRLSVSLCDVAVQGLAIVRHLQKAESKKQ